MLVPPSELRLSAAEQQAVAALPRAGQPPQQTARRGTILLLAHEGWSTQASADQVGTARNWVQKWRERFAVDEPSPRVAQEAVDPGARFGALPDSPRPGRPPAFSPAGAAYGRRSRLPRR